MPRKVTFIETTTGPNFIALEDIPQDVKELVEEAYAKSRKGDVRTHVEYDDEEELKREFKQMVSYAAQRPAGVLRVRRSPTRNLPANVMDFKVSADLPANAAANADGKNQKANQGQRS